MFRTLAIIVSLLFVAAPGIATAAISGHYLEARTCQVYTGPCFANGETGLAGHEAVMAWNVTEGDHHGVDLAGLNVVVVLKSDATLGFGGIKDADKIRSMIIIDDKASQSQRDALVDFAKQRIGRAGEYVTSVTSAPITLSLDTAELKGRLTAGKSIELATRQARPGDCICSNESAYYPPLAEVENFAPGVTTLGNVKARALGSTWSIPQSRSAYMATFAF